MLGLVLLSENWMGSWINGLIKIFVWGVPPKWAFNYSHAFCSGTRNVSLSAQNPCSWCHSRHFHLIFWGPKTTFYSVFEFTSDFCIVSKLDLNFCQIKKSFHFFVDALLVTWSGWTELKSPVFTPSAQHVRVTEEHAWPSRHRSSPATAPKVTEVATAKQRWPSTGRTWAWASALSLPSASASWLY